MTYSEQSNLFTCTLWLTEKSPAVSTWQAVDEVHSGSHIRELHLQTAAVSFRQQVGSELQLCNRSYRCRVVEECLKATALSSPSNVNRKRTDTVVERKCSHQVGLRPVLLMLY